MNFEFATAGRIIFGPGTSRELPAMVSRFSDSAVIVTGRSGRGAENLAVDLERLGVRVLMAYIDKETTIHIVDKVRELALEQDCGTVIGVGGGSVIDAAKAIAAMLNNPGEVLDYLEVVGRGKSIKRPAAPWIAVPTTAGTGAEVTRNAVLDVPERRVKVSLRSHHLLADIAVIDPELTLSLPPEITATTGMDALTQLVEPFVSNAANPLTDGFCRDGLGLVAQSLETAYRDGADLKARTDMCAAALMGGLALSNARLGAVHGFAGVLGGATGHPHGAICARLLPLVMDANLQALRQRPVSGALERYAEIARILTGDPTASAEDGAAWVRDLTVRLAIPPLGKSGLTRSDFAQVIPASKRASSMQGNPITLTDSELEEILDRAL